MKLCPFESANYNRNVICGKPDQNCDNCKCNPEAVKKYLANKK